jgi:hypothetical protein
VVIRTIRRNDGKGSENIRQGKNTAVRKKHCCGKKHCCDLNVRVAGCAPQCYAVCPYGFDDGLVE